MKANRKKATEEFLRNQKYAFAVIWLLYSALAFMPRITRGDVFLILITMGYTDMNLTSKLINLTKDASREMNPVANFFIKHLGKYWLVPQGLIMLGFFYLMAFYVSLNSYHLAYAFMGIYLMIVFNNFVNLRREQIMNKWGVKR